MAFTTGMTAFRRIAPLAALGSLALALTGCTIGTVQLSGPVTGPAQVAGFTGKVIGGEQPVTGATLQIYTYGTTGYGTGATAISGATAFTDASGNFQFSSVSCPDANALTYIVATGGDPGLGTPTGFNNINDINGGVYLLTLNNSGVGAPTYATGSTVLISGLTGSAAFLNGSQTVLAGNTGFNNSTVEISGPVDHSGNTGYNTSTGLIDASGNTNSAIKLVTPSGPCGNLGSLIVNIDEVTTAATAVALAQFISPTTGQIGSPSTALAQTGIQNATTTVQNLVNGQGQPVTTFTQTNSGFTITGTPEATKLGTIADVIASCVNSAGNTGSSSNCGTLFANVGGSTTPTDTFEAAADMEQNPTSNTTQITALYGLVTPQSPFSYVQSQPGDWSVGILYTDTTTGTPVLPQPQNISIDGSGNVFVISNGTGKAALGELSPTGLPLVGTNTGTIVGGTTTHSMIISGATQNPRNLAVDPSGNAWFGTTTDGYLYEYVAASNSLITLPFALSPYGIAIDGGGDVFVGRASIGQTNSASTAQPLAEFVNANSTGGATLSNSSIVNYPAYVGTGTANLVFPQYMGFDPNGNLWMTAGGATALNTNYELSAITPCTPAPCNATSTSTTNVYAPVTLGSPSGPYGITGAVGGIWFANNTGLNISLLKVTGSTPANATGSPFGASTYESKPKFLAVDGAGDVWAPNNGSSSNAGVIEFSSTGALLSPFNVAGGNTQRGFARTSLATPAGIGIDPSGNVWIANNGASTDAASVFEIVGAAAPTITPIAAGLGSKIGTKP